MIEASAFSARICMLSDELDLFKHRKSSSCHMGDVLRTMADTQFSVINLA